MVKEDQSLNTGLRVPADKRFLEIVQIYIRKLGLLPTTETACSNGHQPTDHIL